MENQCEQCGQPTQRRWCSQVCNAASRKTGSNRACVNCAQVFYLRAADDKKGGGKYCSVTCRREHKAANSANYLKVGKKAVHRIVAEQMLGRALIKGEIVHHIDGNRLNNLPENLMVLPSQAAHIRQEIAAGQRAYPHELAVENGRLSGEVRRAKTLNRKAPE